MTGAGFGGCAVALVEKSAVDDFCKNVSDAYQSETGFTPNIYASGAAQGAHRVY
jgi:galactokinase